MTFKQSIRALAAVAAMGLLAACDVPAPGGQSVYSTGSITYFAKGAVKKHSNIVLSKRTQEAFRKFRSGASAYGAMYVSPDGKAWGWHRNRMTLQNAQVVAKDVCEGNLNVDCVLYATISLQSPPPPTAFPVKEKKFLEDAKAKTVVGNYMAVATALSGRYGSSWNYTTASEAREGALSGCRRGVEQQKKEISKRLTAVLARGKYFNCRVIGTFQTQ